MAIDDDDGVLETPPITTVEKKMPDISDDCAEILLDESAQAHTALMTDSKANIQHVSNVARAAGVKKFDEVGAIEAAAAEMVLRLVR